MSSPSYFSFFNRNIILIHCDKRNCLFQNLALTKEIILIHVRHANDSTLPLKGNQLLMAAFKGTTNIGTISRMSLNILDKTNCMLFWLFERTRKNGTWN